MTLQATDMTFYFLNFEHETVEIVELRIFGGCAVVKGRKRNMRAAYVDASGYITVQNAQGLNITVFNSLGNVVRSTKGIGCEQKVYTGAKGMYVVKVGSKAWTLNIK